MKWKLKTTKEKVKCSYKTLYISDCLVEKIDKIAKDNSTSFNNVIISMIEACLNDKKSPRQSDSVSQ
jgi:hypothetical protein